MGRPAVGERTTVPATQPCGSWSAAAVTHCCNGTILGRPTGCDRCELPLKVVSFGRVDATHRSVETAPVEPAYLANIPPPEQGPIQARGSLAGENLTTPGRTRVSLSGLLLERRADVGPAGPIGDADV